MEIILRMAEMAPSDPPVPHIQPPEQIFEGLAQEIKHRPDSPPYPTGIEELDQKIWGLHKGELCCLGGRPGEGKSSLALFMAYTLATQGHKVLFLSLEMTKEQLMERLFCHVCDIDAWDLRRGKIPADYDARVTTFMAMMSKMNLFILDDFGFHFDDLKHLFTVHFPMKPDFVFVDYIQLIDSNGEENRREAINTYLRTLRNLAKKEHVGLVVLSQMNRGQTQNKKGRPALQHFKDTGALEEDADVALLLWWRTMDEEVDPSKTEFRIVVAKQRHGPPGDILINFHPTRFRFSAQPPTTWRTPDAG